MSSKRTMKPVIRKNRIFFEDLYRNYYSPLVQFCEGILFDLEEAKDVAQEVFTDLWSKEEAVQIQSSMKTYLFSCAKYKAFDRLKSLHIIDKNQDQLKEACLNALSYDALPDEELKTKIRNIINGFPSQMKKVLEYHCFYSWKYAEIAEELGISINTVKTHLKKAYKRFKQEFSKDLLSTILMCCIVGLFSCNFVVFLFIDALSLWRK